MKAAILRNLHEPIHLEETAPPVAGKGEAIVKIMAAALNHRDVWIQKGRYPGISLPVTPGSDGAGIVVEVGDRADESWIGKQVLINPAHNWGEIPAHYGPEFKILGLEDPGTFAEYVKIPVVYLHEIPSHLSFNQAAAIPLAGLTAWRCLTTRAVLKPQEKVLITGIGGGVALFVLQFAVALGAEVWVTSGSDDKIQKACELGAKGGVNYKNTDWHRELLQTIGAPRLGYFDVIVDSAGGDNFKSLIDVAAPGARICIYGGTTGNITDLLPAKIFFKQLNLLGSTMGTPKEFEEMIRFVEKRNLVPVIDSIRPIEEIGAGMDRMDKGEQFGKIVFTF